MPVQECQEGDQPGYRWGEQGKCYTYAPGDAKGRAQAKLKAFKQGMAAGETPTGGEMSDDNGVGLHIVLTGAQIDGQGFSWIEVMPTVENARNGDWYFTVTAEDLGTLAEYIQANPDRIPIDYDHAGASENGSTRAAGWFTGESRVIRAGEDNPDGGRQEQDSVWAQVKWTPQAVQEIRDGAFRFISPEWHFGKKDPKTGLLTKLKDLAAATLTNRPFFKDLAPVKAMIESEQLDALAESYSPDVAELVLAGLDAENERMTKAAEAVLAAVGTTDEEDGKPSVTDQGADNDEKETTVADEQPVTDYMKLLGLDETVDPKHRIATAMRDKDEKILALEQKVTELTAAGGEKSKEAEELASRVEELESKDRERDIEVILTRAIDKGRIFPAEKETLAELFAKDVNGLKRMIATRPAEMFANLEPKGVSGDVDRYVDDPDVSQFLKTGPFAGSEDPVDTEQAKQHLMAIQILSEQGKAQTYTDSEYIAAYEQAKTLVY